MAKRPQTLIACPAQKWGQLTNQASFTNFANCLWFHRRPVCLGLFGLSCVFAQIAACGELNCASHCPLPVSHFPFSISHAQLSFPLSGLGMSFIARLWNHRIYLAPSIHCRWLFRTPKPWACCQKKKFPAFRVLKIGLIVVLGDCVCSFACVLLRIFGFFPNNNYFRFVFFQAWN